MGPADKGGRRVDQPGLDDEHAHILPAEIEREVLRLSRASASSSNDSRSNDLALRWLSGLSAGDATAISLSSLIIVAWKSK